MSTGIWCNAVGGGGSIGDGSSSGGIDGRIAVYGTDGVCSSGGGDDDDDDGGSADDGDGTCMGDGGSRDGGRDLIVCRDGGRGRIEEVRTPR